MPIPFIHSGICPSIEEASIETSIHGEEPREARETQIRPQEDQCLGQPKALHPDPPSSSSVAVSAEDDDLRTVYVGRSRKRYLLSPSVVDHPLFRELVKRTGEHPRDDDGVSINVGSEVVLFEHLLWMLEDESDRHDQPESVNELVGFYACS
ncbi:hypothetical protein MLD38_015103 [Melastoma candidum]|uniref:Uncharacterized protein n=1 Tax=Melastoma candidum TaxID=119954 RepID=A0ACB9RF41_9MYRT|nr:hypothetical protein MLD38_015103 [Melastoma candidum]